MTRNEPFPSLTAAKRAAALLHQLDDAQDARRAKEAADDMRHAATCQQLVIVTTTGYTHTISRCDECGAMTTTRHGTTRARPHERRHK